MSTHDIGEEERTEQGMEIMETRMAEAWEPNDDDDLEEIIREFKINESEEFVELEEFDPVGGGLSREPEKPKKKGYYGCKVCCYCKEGHMEDKVDFKDYKGDRRPIDGKYYCLSNNVIYLLYCSEPGCKARYVGCTKRAFKIRFGEHLMAIKFLDGKIKKKDEELVKQIKQKQNYVMEHFTEFHEVDKLRGLVIESCPQEDPHMRRTLESKWIKELQTLRRESPSDTNRLNKIQSIRGGK
ncbi:unnamed protein product [Lymnaea stagnalis]|uniref:GIY-YIG domain-containing protein n=1 Tax=Lymnaea stagnalis TaxID=6523 RepID=A0AAV2IAS6_LYMST